MNQDKSDKATPSMEPTLSLSQSCTASSSETDKNKFQPDPIQELSSLQTLIAQEFPELDYYFHSKQMFLSVTKLSYRGLKYLPSFHLIFTSLSKESFCSRLITYHGRSIDTFIFKCDDKKIPSKVIEVLKDINNEAKLCQGVDENVNRDGLIECINDIIVARHKKCKFMLPFDSQTETCEKCMTLLTKNIKKEFQAPIPRVKLKPDEADWDSIDTKHNLPLLIEFGERQNDFEDYYEDQDQTWERPVSDDCNSIGSSEDDSSWKPPNESKKKKKKPKKTLKIEPAPVSFSSVSELSPLLPKNKKKPGRPPNKPIGPMLRCKICLRGYRTEAAINHHFSYHEKHFDVNDVTECPLCKLTVQKIDITEHFDQHHSTKDESLTCCIFCLKVLSHKSGDNLRFHMYNDHQMNETNDAEDLSQIITNRNANNKKEKVPKIKKPKKPISDRIGRVKCKICLREYISENSLNEHFATHEDNFSIEGNIDCPMCKEPIQKLDVTEHFDRIHSSKEKALTCCMVCLEMMPHKNGDALRLHMHTNHTQKNKNICETCGKSFSHVVNLECHVKTQHSDIKDYFCDRCGKGFGHRKALREHVRVSCADEEWKCNICAKMFHHKVRLSRHLCVHCEEKPYACKLCAYRSYKAENLALHCKKSHQMKGIKSDFITLEDSLKRQNFFVEKHIINAKIK